MPKPTKQVKKVVPDFLKQVADYIEKNGGKAIVLGGIRVRERPPLKYNFTLEVDFTGRPPKSKIKK